MTVSHLFKHMEVTAAETAHGKDGPGGWRARLFPAGALLMLALGLGGLLGLFIANGDWPYVFGLLLLIPAAVLFNSYPYAALMFWMMASLFLQTTPNDAYRMVFWIIHRAMPPAALGLVVLANAFQISKRRAVRLGRAEFAALAFLGWAVVNVLSFQSKPLPYLFWLYDRVFAPICLYLLIRFVAPDEQDLKRLIPLAFFIVLFEPIVGVLSWTRADLLPKDWVGWTSERTIGTLGWAHAYSTTLVFFSLFLFQYAMSHKPGLMRTILLFAVGVGAAGVFLSFSRGSWLGAVVAAAGVLIMYPKPAIRLMIVVLIVMSILGNSVLSKQMAFAQERMNSEDTAKDRWVIWDAGLQMIAAKPLFGWGYGDYSQYAGQFQRRVLNYVASSMHASHHSYIAIAAEMGLPALVLFALPVLWWLRLTFKVWPRLPRTGFWSRSLLVLFWMVILDHIVVNFFSDMRLSPYGMGMWWTTLGLIANMVEAHLQAEDVRPSRWTWHAAQAAK